MTPETQSNQSNRDRRRDEIEVRLRDAAVKLLDEGESYAEISVERLVAEADLSRSTFYVYFDDKGELLRAWLGTVGAQVKDAADPWWEISGGHEREDLRRILAGVLTRYRPHTTLMSAIFDAASYDSLVREQVAAMMEANIATLRAHIVKGQNDGFIDPRLQPPETAEWLMWMAERGQHVLVRAASDAELEGLIDSLTDVIWNTLYEPAKVSRGVPSAAVG